MNLELFLDFLKIPNSPLTRMCFEQIDFERTGLISVRYLLLFLMNQTTASVEEKLKFVFNLFDDEQSQVINLDDMVKILKGTRYCSYDEDVEQKAQILARQLKDPDCITFEEYMALGKANSHVFFPVSLK